LPSLGKFCGAEKGSLLREALHTGVRNYAPPRSTTKRGGPPKKREGRKYSGGGDKHKGREQTRPVYKKKELVRTRESGKTTAATR